VSLPQADAELQRAHALSAANMAALDEVVAGMQGNSAGREGEADNGLGFG
jgi:hypothetical protein